MLRLAIKETQEMTPKVRKLLEQLKQRDGIVSNLVRVMANSTPILQAYVLLQDTVAECSINQRDRQRISLAIAEISDSEYCLAASIAYARSIGMSEDEIQDSRRASSPNPKIDATLKFVAHLVLQRGHVSNESIQILRRHEFTDARIIELIAYVSLSLFGTLLAGVAQVPRGFRKADPLTEIEGK